MSGDPMLSAPSESNPEDARVTNGRQPPPEYGNVGRGVINLDRA